MPNLKLEKYNFCIDSSGKDYVLLSAQLRDKSIATEEEVKAILHDNPNQIVNIKSSFGKIKGIQHLSDTASFLQSFNFDMSLLPYFNKYFIYSGMEVLSAKYCNILKSMFEQYKRELKLTEEYGSIQYEDGTLIDELGPSINDTEKSKDILAILRHRFNVKRGFITKSSDIYDLWFYASVMQKTFKSELLLCPRDKYSSYDLDSKIPEDLYPLLSDLKETSYYHYDLSRYNTTYIPIILQEIFSKHIEFPSITSPIKSKV